MTSARKALCTRLHQIPASQASVQPDAVALWWQGNSLTYETLSARVENIARRLAASGSRNDRIGVLAWNCPDFVELIYAVPASGKILVPLNARLAADELLYQLLSAGVTTLFADPELLAPLLDHPDMPEGMTVVTLDGEYQQWQEAGSSAELPLTAEDDPVWILYTSGSTGRPKGAVLTHRSFMAGLESAAIGRPVAPDDRYFYPFPLFHVAAHNVLLQHQYGAAVVLARSFNAAETLQACRELKVTTMSLAPTMIGLLLDQPGFNAADLQTVRTIGYGASAMPEGLLRRLLAETTVGLCQSYGMTELSGSAAFLTVADHQLAATTRPELLASVGKPLPTVVIRLADERGDSCAQGESGEILVQARQCMLEYWQQPAATAEALEDGWLRTGDIGRFDADGYLYIVDRKKDMVISGGENVASREVEEVLRRHAAVKDCAVIGVPDTTWGEKICAVVQLVSEITEKDLSAHCRRYLAAYKTPRHWLRVDTLPVNAAGKVDKPALRQKMTDQPLAATIKH